MCAILGGATSGAHSHARAGAKRESEEPGNLNGPWRRVSGMHLPRILRIDSNVVMQKRHGAISLRNMSPP